MNNYTWLKKYASAPSCPYLCTAVSVTVGGGVGLSLRGAAALGRLMQKEGLLINY